MLDAPVLSVSNGAVRGVRVGESDRYLGMGAAHAMELGFVFDTLAAPDSIALGGPDAPSRSQMSCTGRG